MTETSLRTQPLPRTATGLSEAEAARLLAVRGPQEPPADESLVREHRPGQRLHGLQPDPRRRRSGDVRVRGLGGRALHRDPRGQLGDRDPPGGEGQARPRPARGPRRANRNGHPRRPPAAGRGRPGRDRRSRPGAGRRPARRRRTAGAERRADRRRVDPDRRVAGRAQARRRGGEVGVVRGGGLGPLHRHGRRSRELRGAGRRRGPVVSPPAVAARALAEPSLARAGRGHDPARRDARLRALVAGEAALGSCHDRRRRRRHARARGPDPAHEPHVRRRRAPHGPPRRARAAAQCDRVARCRRRSSASTRRER